MNGQLWGLAVFFGADFRLLAVRPLVRGLQVEPGFVHRSLGVVVGLHGQAILVYGPVPLSGYVEDLADLDVTPALGPTRFIVAAQGIPV